MLPYESFRAARWVRTINLLLQAVLFLTLFGGLNYLARNHAWRFDLTRQHTFSLSPETLSYIKALERPVQIVVSLSGESDNPEVKGLLNEYARHTEDRPAGKITVEYVDIYQNRRRAEELGLEQADVVLFMSGNKRRAHKVDELYVIKRDERTAFQGEKVVTAAILDVSNQARKKIYFVTGHGELELSDSDPAKGLSIVRDQLRLKNFDVDRLDLATARAIPADASLVIIAQPSIQSSFPGREQEMLREYLKTRAGRILLFLPVGKSVDGYGLADLLFDWGILVDDDWVLDPNGDTMTEDLDLMVRAYDPNHPVVEAVRTAEMPLRFGPTRTVRPDPGRSPASGLNVIPIAGTSRTAWGETAYRDMLRTPPALDAADIRPIRGIPPEGQLGIVVASERVAVRDNLPFTVPGGKMIVFGTGDMISNRRIVANGNLTLFLSAVNWSVDRDRQVNIQPRPLERFSLALSAAEFSRLRYTLLLVLPGTTLLLGLVVYWTRRV